MSKHIKILIVDDSKVVRDLLSYTFSNENDLEVVGAAKNGKEAIELSLKLKPDIITMDIEMPVMNGFEATREIMSTCPVPIIIVTASFQKSDVEKSFKALDAGAVAIFEKPQGIDSAEYDRDIKLILANIRLLSEVKLVTRKKSRHTTVNKGDEFSEPITSAETGNFSIAAIGISTGGPPVLNNMFSMLPKDFSIPILVAQHIPMGFVEGLVDWLNQKSALPVEIASDGMIVSGGKIYFNPPGKTVSVDKNFRLKLSNESHDIKTSPSVSQLFNSILKTFGNRAIGVLMTGIGKDGADELLNMKKRGALTIAQDENSSVVFGMPGEAVKLNACRYILNPEDIVRKLAEINNKLI